jgi:hypothetical protein
VLVSTFAGILGTYHRTAPIETFPVTNTTSHPTAPAGLIGARLVAAIETEEGRRGGNPQPARIIVLHPPSEFLTTCAVKKNIDLLMN